MTYLLFCFPSVFLSYAVHLWFFSKCYKSPKIFFQNIYLNNVHTSGPLQFKSMLFRALSSVVQVCLTLCNPMDCSTWGFPVQHKLPELAQTHFHQVSDAIQKSHPLLSPSPPTLNFSQHQSLFKWSALHNRWPKYWSFSFNLSPSNEHSGLIFFRMDWLDLLVVQGTLKSLLQHHSSKASILWCSAFFIVQLSHPYMTTGKTIALTRRSFVSKVMSPVFNMLSTFITAFLPRSKRLLISWLQSPFAVILEPPRLKSVHCFHCLPIYSPWSDGTRCHDLNFLNVEF